MKVVSTSDKYRVNKIKNSTDNKFDKKSSNIQVKSSIEKYIKYELKYSEIAGEINDTYFDELSEDINVIEKSTDKNNLSYTDLVSSMKKKKK